MSKSPEKLRGPHRRDLIKLACFFACLLATSLLFLATPALTLPTLSALTLTVILAPSVAWLERKGLSRTASITGVFAFIGFCLAAGSLLAAQAWQNEWLSFCQHAPSYFTDLIARISAFETAARKSHPLLENVSIAANLAKAGNSLGDSAMKALPSLVAGLLNCALLVPLLTFFFLSEGRKIRKSLFQLVPNRFFESIYIMTHGVSASMSDFLRAKLIQAFLLSALTSLGLLLVGSPYAIVLGIWAGVANILPYVGPVAGALPGIMIAIMDPSDHASLGPFSTGVWGMLMVYLVTHLIDNIVIFPSVVARVVKLNPLVLIASVIVGEHFFGILGMLIAIPIAAALKVILYELYLMIYGFVPEFPEAR